MFFCKHQYGKIENDGYQYCEKCGKAIPVEKPKCGHKWNCINRFDSSMTFSKYPNNVIYVLQCEKCGNIKKTKVRD